MTKDEYGDFVLRYKGCGACFPMYHTLSRFEKMWFSAIQKDVADLEKENEELKGLKDVATLIRANNDTVITLMQLNNMLVSKSQQLTKAKLIIKDLLADNTDWTHKLEAEQFLKGEDIILEDAQAGNSPFDADEVFNKGMKAYPEEK